MIGVDKGYTDYRSPKYATEFKKFIEERRETWGNDPSSTTKAKEVLIKTGIADENGHIKDRIISWE